MGTSGARQISRSHRRGAAGSPRWRGVTFWTIVAALALAGPARADLAIGRPAIQRHIIEAPVYPSNFAVAEGPDGVVYVGNAEGVLGFDGATWQHHPVGENEVARALAHDGFDRLYVGGYDSFGYFETPLSPESTFVDLTRAFGLDDPGFAEIWQVVIAPEGVFFVALNDVFGFDPATGQTRHWHHEGRFGAMARIDGELLLQYRGEGLRVLRDDEFVRLSGSEALAGQLYQILPLPGRGFIATARDGGWYTWIENRAGRFQAPPGLPDSQHFTAATALTDGRIALGSSDGWIHVLDTRSRRFDAFKVAPGWIADLKQSRQGGLIAQTDLATLYIDWPARWTVWDASSGLTGSVLETLRWQDRWLVLSNGGAFVAGTGDPVAFESTGWTDFEAWDFEPLGDGSGLLAESYELRHVALDGVIQVVDGIRYPRSVRVSRFDESLFLVGTEEGLSWIRRDTGGFELVASEQESGPVFSFHELDPSRILVATQGNGIQLLVIDAGHRIIERRRVDAAIDYAGAEYADLVVLDDELFAATENGHWRWTGDGFVAADTLGLQALATNEFISLRQAPDGDLWAFDYRTVWRRATGSDTWQRMKVAPLLEGAIASVDFDADGRAFVGASGRVAIFDPDAPQPRDTVFEPRYSRIVLKTDAAGARVLTPADSPLRLELQPFSIRFDYTLPGLSQRDRIRYRARMRGLETQFTDWEATSHYTYLNLAAGSYAFEVQARTPYDEVLSLEPFMIEVVPPWYATPLALKMRWVLGVLVLGLVVWLLIRLRVRRLEHDRRRLAAKVRKRTEALVAANRKLKHMAEVDDLTGIANRRRFDHYLAERLAEHRDSGRALAVALIDLDEFKPYNDRNGHLEGDRMLVRIARFLQSGFGDDERLVARFGGDEFAAVLPGMTAATAEALTERLRLEWARECPEIRLSIGIAAVHGSTPIEPVELLRAADRELYAIKRSGRNGISATTVV